MPHIGDFSPAKKNDEINPAKKNDEINDTTVKKKSFKKMGQPKQDLSAYRMARSTGPCPYHKNFVVKNLKCVAHAHGHTHATAETDARVTTIPSFLFFRTGELIATAVFLNIEINVQFYNAVMNLKDADRKLKTE